MSDALRDRPVPRATRQPLIIRQSEPLQKHIRGVYAYPVFEWDDAKAARNSRDHQVTFDFARYAFDDPALIGHADTRKDYREDRYVVLGRVNGRLLVVVFTPRGTAIRLISARKANHRERQAFKRQTGQDG